MLSRCFFISFVQLSCLLLYLGFSFIFQSSGYVFSSKEFACSKGSNLICLAQLERLRRCQKRGGECCALARGNIGAEGFLTIFKEHSKRLVLVPLHTMRVLSQSALRGCLLRPLCEQIYSELARGVCKQANPR